MPKDKLILKDLMTREYWGLKQVHQYSDDPLSSVQLWVTQKDFPDVSIIFGAHTRGWRRQDVIAYFKKRREKVNA